MSRLVSTWKVTSSGNICAGGTRYRPRTPSRFGASLQIRFTFAQEAARVAWERHARRRLRPSGRYHQLKISEQPPGRNFDSFESPCDPRSTLIPPSSQGLGWVQRQPQVSQGFVRPAARCWGGTTNRSSGARPRLETTGNCSEPRRRRPKAALAPQRGQPLQVVALPIPR